MANYAPDENGTYSNRNLGETNCRKAEAMNRLLGEIDAGIRSAEEEGWISEEDFRAHFRNRRNEIK